MIRVEPSGPRYATRQAGSQWVVSVPARRNWFVLLFLTAWLGIWTFAGFDAFAEVMREAGKNQAFMIFWLAGWFLGELYAIAIVLWQLAGSEELAFTATSLRQRVAAAGLGRTREFRGSEIKDLRASPNSGIPGWADQSRYMPPLFGAGYGAIAFDYGAKTFRVGAGLDEAEARILVAEIGKRFPRMVEDSSK